MIKDQARQIRNLHMILRDVPQAGGIVVEVLDAGVRLGMSPSLSLAPGPDREGLALLLRAVRREVAREQWAQFTTENAKFFDRLGSPDGAAKTGLLP